MNQSGPPSLAALAPLVVERPSLDLGAPAAATLEGAIRSCMTAIALGGFEERGNVPVAADLGHLLAANPSRDVLHAMSDAVLLGTLGAAADLDPLDAGPAHLALPTVAAVLAAAGMRDADESLLADAVCIGMEVGARLRAAIKRVRPGIGFHSVGTFGVVAAAAGAAVLLNLDEDQAANAFGIALTRAGGLASNNAMTDIGLTHFGWAAAHGLEAAWLATLGYTATTGLEQIAGTLFPGCEIAPELLAPDPLTPGTALSWPARIIFKNYPCNVYLNPLVAILRDDSPEPLGHVLIEMPPVAHLDNPVATGARQMRNSAQAVTAIAACLPCRYDSFTSRQLDANATTISRLMSTAVTVVQTPDGPTDLLESEIRVTLTGEGQAARTCVRKVAQTDIWDGSVAGRIVDGAPYAETILELCSLPYLEAARLLRQALISSAMHDRRSL
jgi:MmgE/PrpD N-terminal domain